MTRNRQYDRTVRRRLRRLGTTCALVGAVLASVAAAGAEPLPGSVNWLSYRAARAAGRDLDRPILLQFTAGWSEESARLMRETYGDLRVVKYIERHFAAARVDVRDLPSLARKYRVDDPPTLWLLDPKGGGLTSVRGYVPPQKLLSVLEFVQTKAYETTDFQTWIMRDKRRRSGQ